MKALTLFDSKQYEYGDPNPCIYAFGKGPEGKHCRTCRSLRAFGGEGRRRRWYKCLLRRSPQDPTKMGGPSTDHRVRWNACAKYMEEGR